MDIYIEYVIIDNMVINSIILWGTMKTLGRRVCRLKILCSAALGTAFALFLPLIPLQNPFATLLKLIMGIIMTLIATRDKSFKEFLKTFLLFLCYTFLLGGVATGLIYGTKSTFDALTINYMSSVPMGVIALAVFIFAVVLIKLAKYIFRQKNYGGFIREAELKILGKKYLVRAFIDSGNMLYDHKSGLPVVVVNKKLISDAIADTVVKNKTLNSHSIEITTASGKQKMLILHPESLTIYHNSEQETNIINEFCIGVSNEDLKFDMLLHPGIF